MIPQPAINPDNAYFWEGVSEGQLRIQRCATCMMLRHPSSPACPACASLEWDALAASGRGRVFTYATVHHPLSPPYELPYVLTVIELEEGVRMLSRLLDDHTDERLRIGAAVEVAFTDTATVTLPLFRLSR